MVSSWCTTILNKKREKKLLLIGLDYSGKTTLLKQFAQQSGSDKINQGEAELVMTTPFINVEVIKLPFSNDECIVYDMSG